MIFSILERRSSKREIFVSNVFLKSKVFSILFVMGESFSATIDSAISLIVSGETED